ncbi:MAG: phosphoglucomutase/phosphomannomutase family protein [Nitrolancea sp.]
MTIRFGTDGWRAVIADEFTFEAVRRIARAMSAVLVRDADRGRPAVVVGYDRRFGSDEFARAATDEFIHQGVDVLYARSPIPTPMLSYTVNESKSVAGMMITASHNPPMFNGVKIKSAHGGAAPTSILRAIEAEIAGSEQTQTALEYGEVTEIDPFSAYLDRIGRHVDLARIRDAGLTIVVDAMYGCAAGLLPRLIGEASTQIIEINTVHNPLFPGIAGPEPVERNLTRLRKVVGDGGANLGIGFDGDGDRIGVVNGEGEYISAQTVFALLTRYVLEYRSRGGAIVKSVTGTAMIDALGEQFSVPVIETATGFTHISQAMIDEHAAIGGEESGGFAFGFHLPDRDGILASLLLIDFILQSGMSLTELIDDLEQAIGTWRFRRVDLPLARDERDAFVDRLSGVQWPRTMSDLAVTNVVEVDGTRVEFADGSWLLVRISGTEPLLRIYAESHDVQLVDSLLMEARLLLGA